MFTFTMNVSLPNVLPLLPKICYQRSSHLAKEIMYCGTTCSLTCSLYIDAIFNCFGTKTTSSYLRTYHVIDTRIFASCFHKISSIDTVFSSGSNTILVLTKAHPIQILTTVMGTALPFSKEVFIYLICYGGHWRVFYKILVVWAFWRASKTSSGYGRRS